MLAREQARHRPKVFPQWGEGLEFLGDVEPDDARIEREDVGSQAAVVAVQKGIGYRRLVEQVLDIKLERQSAVGPFNRERHVGVIPRFQTVDRRIINARPAFALAIIIAAKGDVPIIDWQRILCAEIDGPMWRVGQLLAAKIGIEPPTLIGRICYWIIGHAIY